MRLFLLGLAAALAGCGGGSEIVRPPPAKPAPKILQFYASEGVIRPGETVTICYGVENATAVRMEPYVEPLSPSHNRCFQTSPKRTAVFRLTAEGEGPPATAEFEIKVDANARPSVEAARPPVLIQFFSASADGVPKGAPVTVCYGVKDAVSVSIKPNVRALEPAPRHCFSLALDVTTTLTLTATDAAGRTDTERLTINVR
jgi:hypothetical protein